MKKTGWMILFIVALVSFSWADEARQIMEAVDARDDGRTMIGQVSMTTFTYVIREGKILAAETPRVKRMTVVRKDEGPRGKDHKSISILIEPKRERGIGFLQFDYDEVDKDTDQWMYLSALGKVKRIVAGSDDEPKTGSYFGSEFNYEDMEAQRIDDYTYSLQGQGSVSGTDCWVIDAVPVPRKAQKSNYSRQTLWVDTQHAMVLKTDLFNRNGRKTKTIHCLNIESIDGIRVARTLVADSPETRRRTVLVYDTLALNRPVDDGFLTVRTLTDTGYRERKLRDYQE